MRKIDVLGKERGNEEGIAERDGHAHFAQIKKTTT